MKETLIPMATSYCLIEQEEERIWFWIIFGYTSGDSPQSSIHKYDIVNNEWEIVRQHESNDLIRSQAGVIKNGNKIIFAGGDSWKVLAYQEIIELDIITNEFAVIGMIPMQMFQVASAFINKQLYIHGGGDSLGQVIRPEVSIGQFIKIDFECENCHWLCSPGTYALDSKCEKCPMGSYNSQFGAEICTLCPQGTYLDIIGGVSPRQCLPCPEGQYQDQEGQSFCYQCPTGFFYCPTGSTQTQENDIKVGIETDQPKIYEEYDTESTRNWIILGTILAIASSILIILTVQKLRPYLIRLDIFKELHNHRVDEPMYLKRTIGGGAFTVFFMILVSTLISLNFLDMLYNQTENKALVPLVSIQEQYQEIKGDIQIIVTFTSYGGDCIEGGNMCTSMLSYQFKQITGELKSPECSRNNQGACLIFFQCLGCEISTGASLTIQLSEASSYASSISVEISSTSSIPDENSQLIMGAKPEKGKVLRGFQPTEFFILLTPSVFLSTVSDWESLMTGYHISPQQEPIAGSSYTIKELIYSADLKLEIQLIRDNTALITKRFPKQSLVLIFSGLIGSIAGLMGGVGASMKFLEKNYQRVTDRFKLSIKHKDLFQNRENIGNQMYDQSYQTQLNTDSAFQTNLMSSSDAQEGFLDSSEQLMNKCNGFDRHDKSVTEEDRKHHKRKNRKIACEFKL